MQTQQTENASRRDAMTDGLGSLTREVIREPVKEAVREALQEEAVVRAPEEDGTEAEVSTAAEAESEDEAESGGPPVALVLLSLGAVAGIVYYVRNRGEDEEESVWSDFEEETSNERAEYDPESAGTAGDTGTPPATE